jgi:hypothetical protein
LDGFEFFAVAYAAANFENYVPHRYAQRDFD